MKILIILTAIIGICLSACVPHIKDEPDKMVVVERSHSDKPPKYRYMIRINSESTLYIHSDKYFEIGDKLTFTKVPQ